MANEDIEIKTTIIIILIASDQDIIIISFNFFRFLNKMTDLGYILSCFQTNAG